MKLWRVVVLLAWFFAVVGRGQSRNAAVFGPFENEAQCEAIKAQVVTGYRLPTVTDCWEKL